MKTILFNCSTNIVGGGVKNSAFFIKKVLSTDTPFNWHFAVSQQVYGLLQKWQFSLPESQFTVFKDSPARNKSARKELAQLAVTKSADLVYTMAGPAYVSFKCKHLLGISNPYITHAAWGAFRLKGNLFSALKYYGYVFIQYLYSLKADYYLFQTNFASNSFRKRTGFRQSRLFVVPNAFDFAIKQHFQGQLVQKSNDDIVTFFCPGAGYVHKAFQFIPSIIEELRKVTHKKFKFILTLPFNSLLWQEIDRNLKSGQLSEYCENIGPFDYTEIVPLLERADVIFVPSLLETFSASYLEAMCAGKKLIVADKNFAREICGNYANYIRPQDALKTAGILAKEIEEIKISEEQLQLGNYILKSYGDQDSRFTKIIDIINTITK